MSPGDGGEDGLDAFRTIFSDAGSFLKPGGRLYLEIGFDQAKPIGQFGADLGWRLDRLVSDLGGKDRVMVFSYL